MVGSGALLSGAMGSLPPITGGTAGPSSAESKSSAGISFGSPFAVGAGASSNAEPPPLFPPAAGGLLGGQHPLLLLAAGGALLVVVLMLARRR